jgi:hypothetical protein
MSKTKQGSNIERLLRTTFGNVPIVEAKTPLRVQPNEDDIAGAVRKDEENCVSARACRRQYGSTKAIFWRCRAYVELLDEKGRRRVERFNIPEVARKMIRDFDKGKKIAPGGFTLTPPPPKQTLDYLAAKQRERAFRIKDGTHKPATRTLKAGMSRKSKSMKWDDVRHGQGAVRFAA